MGIQGTSGIIGTYGTIGTRGTQGYRGYKGTFGTHGTQGYQGISGADVIASPWICEDDPSKGSVLPTQHLDFSQSFNISPIINMHAPPPSYIYIPTEEQSSDWIGLPVITDNEGRLLVAFPTILFDNDTVMEQSRWYRINVV